MGLARRRNIPLGFGALALVALLVIAVLASRLTSRTQLLSGISDGYLVRWLGSDALLLIEEQKGTPMRFDLATRRLTPLPFLPDDTLDLIPSPDGRWVLYKESQGGGSKNTLPYGVRWRAVRMDGSETRMFPADGSFRPAPDEITEPVPCAYWLPDSSGWISVALKRRGHHQLWERFRLDAVDGAPERLTFPQFHSERPHLKTITPDGRLVFKDPSEQTLQLCSPLPGRAPSPLYSLRLGSGDLDTILAVEGNTFLGVVTTAPKTGLAAWMGRIFHQEDSRQSLWRITFNSDAYTRITGLPFETYDEQLSPDQKHLLCRNGHGTYLLALPEDK
ncbi:hypothetical protein [Armatimonas rosea]|uniref:WD40 repeat protein n=1 Tax=Armatimonas rosea TaxID=685828 RepID=A0A7W9SN62_ARMRO|nr:hypothetical protein [Armatimonas rosea]MBB6049715.1 hypothetical protein [Armatimonas rosea]